MRWLGILLTGASIAALVLITDFAPSILHVTGAVAILLAGWMVHEAAGLHPQRMTIPGIWLAAPANTTGLLGVCQGTALGQRIPPPASGEIARTGSTIPIGAK